ncbi:hypothetical protein [Leuconostoc lactis]|uniref:hypothetical protein n=1 Tax=Leuconostoc lactis TaxID=1246 RepID=UPI0025B2192A|nr:hypothetical protein [Leuconostoc lactis]
MFDEKVFREQVNNWHASIPEHRFVKENVMRGNIKDVYKLISIIKSSFVKK